MTRTPSSSSSPRPPATGDCPQCGSEGKQVGRITLESLLTPTAAARIGDEPYRFCDSIDCETVYFGDSVESFAKNDLTVRVGVKEHAAPRHACYCFDHTFDEIDAEIRQTGQTTVLDDISARLKIACWCETKNPQGSCCLGTVGRYVKQAIAEQGHTPEAELIGSEQRACCSAESSDRPLGETEASVSNDCCSTSKQNGDAKDKSQRTGMLAAGGSALTALAASACCWIPLGLMAFGVSAGGVASWFEQYRLLFLGLTAFLLGTGFYFVYFRKARCAPGSSCATPNLKLMRFNRAMLWMATVVVIFAAAFPKYVGYLIPANDMTPITVPANHVGTASIDIEGMSCEACAIHVKNALATVPGVLDVVVSYSDSSATVRFDDATPPGEEELALAIKKSGYTVKDSDQ